MKKYEVEIVKMMTYVPKVLADELDQWMVKMAEKVRSRVIIEAIKEYIRK